MKLNHKTVIAWAGMASLASASVYALFAVLKVIGLALAENIPLLAFAIFLVFLEVVLSAAQVALSAVLIKKGDRKILIILLLVLFSVSLLFAVLNFILGNINFFTISQFSLCAVSISLLIASLVIRDKKDNPTKE